MSEEKFVIIGDGIAGATAAENIRDRDEDAQIRVFTDESEPLYNRLMLKNYMKGSLPKQYTRVHDESWYEDRDVDLHMETRVENVDEDKKTVETEEGEAFEYDTLLVATGGSPREFPADEGYDNVHYMWTMSNADRIKKAAEESEEAVVIGGGLLGIDLAVAFAENGAETHYLIRESNWWHRGLDEEGASIVHEKLEDIGVNVVTETEASEFVAEDGNVEKVVSKDGREFGCDNIAVAIGQTPNSGIVDVEKTERGLRVDKYLQTSDEDIYAAGNMVEYYSPVFEERTVKGSWDHSDAMGEQAGKNMVGEDEEFDYVNTYGVGHFRTQFLAIGDWTGEPISKKYEDESHYRRLYFKGDRLVGAVMIGYTRGQEKLKELIHDKEEFEDKEKLLEKSYWE